MQRVNGVGAEGGHQHSARRSGGIEIQHHVIINHVRGHAANGDNPLSVAFRFRSASSDVVEGGGRKQIPASVR